MAEKENSSMGASVGEHASAPNVPDRDEEVTTDCQGDDTPDPEEDGPPAMTSFPIVAVGASAGGLEAFTSSARLSVSGRSTVRIAPTSARLKLEPGPA